MISASVILNTSSPGYPFEPCFRLGGNITQQGGEGVADVILVTDVSGSMIYRINQTNITGDFPEKSCDDPSLYQNSTRRINLARCLAKDFVNKILNISGNKVGLAAFNESIVSFSPLSSDSGVLAAQINAYNPAHITSNDHKRADREIREIRES